MDPERREDLKRLFERAYSLPAGDRNAFLEENCADDPEARAELSSLLTAADGAEPLFEELAEAVIPLPPGTGEPTWSVTSDEEYVVGRTVHQYRIEEKLGAGGMGVVYRAHDTRLDRSVALKFLPQHVVADEDAAERFVVEARAAAALDHPNVCMVHEISRDEDDRPFIAMAYYAGETLKQKLARGALPLEEAADYAAQIAAGLGAAHAHGIVHRDVKPGNVIVTSDGVAKILDFGLAKLADVALTGTGVTLGTAAYMSPEQTWGEELDARTDLWSLGVVLYEMLTGQRPFRGDRQVAVINAIRHEEPEPPSTLRDEVPAEVEALVLGLLSKEPDDRYGSAQALLGDLAPLAPAAADLEVAAEQHAGRARRKRMMRGVAGVLALAAIGGGAVLAVLAVLRGGAGVPLDPDRVAVAVLANQTGEAALDALGRQATERITQAVQQREVADVVPTEVALAAAEASEGRGGMDAVAALARASGAGVVLHGAYYLLGDSLHFQIQITDVAEGEVMSAMAPVSAPRNAPGEALSLLQERTLGALAAALDFRAGNLDLPTQPPSLEAYRLFWQGEDAWNRFQYEEALGYFEQASAMDSTWMTPLLYLFLTVIDADPARADSVARFVAERTEHMSEPEHLMYQVLRSHFDDEDATVKLSRARRMVRLAPGYGLWFGYWVAWQAYRPHEALEFLVQVDTTGRRFERHEREHWSLVGYMHHSLGNHEAELEAVLELRRRSPTDQEASYRQKGQRRHVAVLAALGRLEEMDALLDTVLAQPGVLLRDEIIILVNELRTHGFDDAARAAAQRGLDWLEARTMEEVREDPTGYRGDRAEILYALGRWQEARDLYEQLLDEFGYYPQFRAAILASLASAAARLGDVQRARAISGELANMVEEVQRSGTDVEGVFASDLLTHRARIAAVLGEREQAVRFLEEGFRATRHKGYFAFDARHWTDLHLLYDYLPFQQFVKPRG